MAIYRYNKHLILDFETREEAESYVNYQATTVKMDTYGDKELTLEVFNDWTGEFEHCYERWVKY